MPKPEVSEPVERYFVEILTPDEEGDVKIGDLRFSWERDNQPHESEIKALKQIDVIFNFFPYQRTRIVKQIIKFEEEIISNHEKENWNAEIILENE